MLLALLFPPATGMHLGYIIPAKLHMVKVQQKLQVRTIPHQKLEMGKPNAPGSSQAQPQDGKPQKSSLILEERVPNISFQQKERLRVLIHSISSTLKKRGKKKRVGRFKRDRHQMKFSALLSRKPVTFSPQQNSGKFPLCFLLLCLVTGFPVSLLHGKRDRQTGSQETVCKTPPKPYNSTDEHGRLLEEHKAYPLRL